MKFKLTIGHPDIEQTDITLTTDVTATVADAARRIAMRLPAGHELRELAISQLAPLTLRVRRPAELGTLVLDPSALLGESGLRSGCWVQPIKDGQLTMEDSRAYEPAVQVQVANGPQSGTAFTLVHGTNSIGRDPGARVYLQDGSVSRRHAIIDIGSQVTAQDVGSGNGTRLDGTPILQARITKPCTLSVGNVDLNLFPLPTVASSSKVSAESVKSTVDHVRSPRLDTFFAGETVELPQPPSPGDAARFPFIAIIAPLIMGGVLFAVTKSPLSLLFVALSPIIMLGTYFDGRSTAKRKKRRLAARFRESLDDATSTLERQREREIATRTRETPSVAEVAEAMAQHSPLLWTRRPEHQAFLEVRFGLGELPSRTPITRPSRNDAPPEMWHELDELEKTYSTVSGVPVVERLDRCGALGVAGEPAWAFGLAQSLIVQLTGLHSPADLAVTCFAAGAADSATMAPWQWLKWLPHVDSVYSPVGASHLSNDTTSAALLLASLEGVVETRRATHRTEEIRSHLDEDDTSDQLHGKAVTRLPITPVVIVLVLSDADTDRSRLVSLAEDGADVGVHVIWVADTVAALPAACRTYVDAGVATGTVGFIRSATPVTLSSIETLDGATALTAATQISAVADIGARVLDESDLPHSVNYSDLQTSDVIASSAAVIQAWGETDSLHTSWRRGHEREAGGLSALVGQSTASPLHLDLRTHGPHALVGGTTGSGKSEFLQTWIMSLAARYSSDRLTFLLVDYKGGAAFAECTDLPHTVGLVTDLNTHLVRRALASLRAELHYREELLNTKGVKDLVALERNSDPDAPPSLLIVIDEFAALVNEVPEFVDGVVDVAQRGRSLGLHLIMATQRPAGVIKDNLRANTNIRVALRVADETDSVDVLGVKDAANFDPGTPGRGAVKVGPGRILHFQTGYLGAASGQKNTAVNIDIRNLPFSEGDLWPPAPTADKVSSRGRQRSAKDIEKLLDSITVASKTLSLTTPRKPWLDELPTVVALHEVMSSGGTAIGLVDEPSSQNQSNYRISLDTVGNLSLVGASGAGKSNALRTIAAALSLRAPDEPVWIYGLDFAGGALEPLRVLPTVGAVIGASDDERVRRLLRELGELIEERTARYSGARASTLTEYRRQPGRAEEPRVVVLLDGLGNFRTTYEFQGMQNPMTSLTNLMAAGRAVGVHFVITADRGGLIPAGMQSSIQQQIIFRLAAKNDYGLYGISPDILEDAPPGRAVAFGGEGASRGTEELHIAVYGGTTSLSEQATALERLATELLDEGVPRAKTIETMPTVVNLDTLPATARGLSTLGIAETDLRAIGFPTDGLFVVSGPARSGRTTTIRTAVNSVAQTNIDLDAVLLSPSTTSSQNILDWTSYATDSDTAAAEANHLITALGGIAPAQSGGTTTLFGANLFEPATPQTPEPEANAVQWPRAGAKGLIVIESIGDFDGTGAEFAIAALIKTARRKGILVIAELDPVTGPSAWQIYAELKTARAGILLQPDENDGVPLFRTSFPKAKRNHFPPGRGFMVISGVAHQLQVALS